MKEIVRKIAQKLYSYQTKEVQDLETKQKEIAIYHKILGVVIKTSYKAV